MRIFKRIFALITAFTFILCAYSCKSGSGTLDFTCFNTDVHVQSQNKNVSDATAKKIKDLFFLLESEFDADDENSLVYKFNAAQANAVFPLSEHAFNVLSAAKTVYSLSDGYFDPSVYPLVKLWGFAPFRYSANFTPPSESEIAAELEKVDFEKAVLDGQNKTLTKTDGNLKLDLGGIVKGYAADLAARILKDAGHTDGYVNVGGSSLNLLSVSELDVRHPRATYGNTIITVNCSESADLSVSTSGDYEKYYKDVNGKTYCHIINPKTGYPADTGVASATLLGVDGLISDALTTALCLKAYSPDGQSELTEFIDEILTEYPDCAIFIVYQKDDDKIVLTNKTQGEHFTLNDSEYTVVNI